MTGWMFVVTEGGVCDDRVFRFYTVTSCRTKTRALRLVFCFGFYSTRLLAPLLPLPILLLQVLLWRLPCAFVLSE